MTRSQLINFLEELGKLKQEAKDRKVSTDDGEKARNWAVVHTELQKVYAFVSEYLSEEEE